jgi:hypothetical protein
LSPRPVLNRLGDMRRLDVLRPGQIGDGALQFEPTVISASAEVHLLHGCLEQGLAGGVDLAESADLGRAHPRDGEAAHCRRW